MYYYQDVSLTVLLLTGTNDERGILKMSKPCGSSGAVDKVYNLPWIETYPACLKHVPFLPVYEDIQCCSKKVTVEDNPVFEFEVTQM